MCTSKESQVTGIFFLDCLRYLPAWADNPLIRLLSDWLVGLTSRLSLNKYQSIHARMKYRRSHAVNKLAKIVD